MSDDSKDFPISIGAVSRATDIPAATLRTWERRYGFPDPDRNEAGHRIYDREIVDRLRLTHRAVDAGYRPSNVVGMTGDELRELLDPSDLNGSAPGVDAPDVAADVDLEPEEDWLAKWLRASSELDGDALTRYFRNDWNQLGGLEFLRRRAGPFLQRLGEAWAADELKVVHEHYTSEVLRDFLSAHWRPRASRSRGPEAVLATPEGEQHALGLHLVAAVLAIAGWRIAFLGPNTPAAEVVEAVRADSPDAVAVSVARSYRAERAASFLSDLCDEFSNDVDLLVGGGGAPNVDDDVETFSNLESLYDWAFERAH